MRENMLTEARQRRTLASLRQHAEVRLLESRVLLAAVFTDGQTFNMRFTIKNTDASAWTGYYLERVAASSRLGGRAERINLNPVPAGNTVMVTLSLTATKMGGSAGAAQLGAWELKRNNGAVYPVSGPGGGRLWCEITVAPVTGGLNVPNLRHSGYTRIDLNPYAQSYGGQCTGFTWGRAYEKMCWRLPVTTNAGKQWGSALQSAGYQKSTTPVANSIALWHLNSDPARSGHAAFVESVNMSTNRVGFNEANIDSYRSWASVNSPSGIEWGGGYDGSVKAWDIMRFQNQRTGYTFIGYFYK